MKVRVKKGTKTWFLRGIGDDTVAEFKQDTEVEVEQPQGGGTWYRSVGDISGFRPGERVFLGEEMFEGLEPKPCGYWESDGGQVWDEQPYCSFCTRPATRTTPVDGILLCDEEACWHDFIVQECGDEIEFVEESLEGKARQYADEVLDQALEDLLYDDKMPYDEARARAEEESEVAYQKFMEEHDEAL